MVLAERAEIEIPRSFISRRSIFKDKLLLRLGYSVDCVQTVRTPEFAYSHKISPMLLDQLAANTHTMFGLYQEDKFSESTPGRKDRDKKDEWSLLTILKQFKVFSPPEHPTCLYNIATKDLVTDHIQVSLLSAKELGRQQMKDFVEQMLTSASQQQQDRSSEVRFWDTMHKNNAIDNLYQVAKRRTKPQF